MAASSDDGIEETRAALAPTLDATAAILPWLAKPKPLRFPAELNRRWTEASKGLSEAWSLRHGSEEPPVRAKVFELYEIALKTGDSDCLRIGEALASAADRLEAGKPSPKLIAAFTGALECLADPSGLEHPALSERLRHFALRLEGVATASGIDAERSLVLDRIFIGEAEEHLAAIREALELLPIDAYALKLEASELARKSEQLELFGLMHLARKLGVTVSEQIAHLDSDSVRTNIQSQVKVIADTLAAVDR